LLSKIVAKAHAAGLRVSTHVNNADDFHLALTAGVDEIAHLPLSGLTPIADADARLAARRGVPVITTCAIVPALPSIAKNDLPQVLKMQLENLKLLRDRGVRLAIGSDSVNDTSVREAASDEGRRFGQAPISSHTSRSNPTATTAYVRRRNCRLNMLR
jgi:imidazolonepropionase-like amidohydrolase